MKQHGRVVSPPKTTAQPDHNSEQQLEYPRPSTSSHMGPDEQWLTGGVLLTCCEAQADMKYLKHLLLLVWLNRQAGGDHNKHFKIIIFRTLFYPGRAPIMLQQCSKGSNKMGQDNMVKLNKSAY